MLERSPLILCCKISRNWIELGQDLYLSICKLFNLLPFENRSQGVLFWVDLFFRPRRPRNIMGAVARNPRFDHIKTVLCLTIFKTSFQVTIMQSYWAAMFVLHVDTLKAFVMFAPRSCAVKKSHGASLKEESYYLPCNSICSIKVRTLKVSELDSLKWQRLI